MTQSYDVYVVNDHGVHDVLYGISKSEADHIAKELADAVVTPSGERPAKKAKAATSE
jgi:hypothetical protein